MWPLFVTVMIVFMFGRHDRFPPGSHPVGVLPGVGAGLDDDAFDTGGRVSARYRLLLRPLSS